VCFGHSWRCSKWDAGIRRMHGTCDRQSVQPPINLLRPIKISTAPRRIGHHAPPGRDWVSLSPAPFRRRLPHDPHLRLGDVVVPVAVVSPLPRSPSTSNFPGGRTPRPSRLRLSPQIMDLRCGRRQQAFRDRGSALPIPTPHRRGRSSRPTPCSASCRRSRT